jgi:hypothetical protein
VRGTMNPGRQTWSKTLAGIETGSSLKSMPALSFPKLHGPCPKRVIKV